MKSERNLIKNLISDKVAQLYKKDAGEISTRLLKNMSSKFNLIYLDPPYNTGRARGSRKVYKDTSSTWAEEILPVIENTHSLLADSGFLAMSINQMELFNLKSIIDRVYSDKSFIGLFPIKIRHKDRQLMINATFHDLFEYLLIYRKSPKTRFYTESQKPDPDKYIYKMNVFKNERPEVYTFAGKKIEVYKPHQYSVDEVAPSLDNLRRYVIAGKIATANWSGEFFENHLRKLGKDLLIKVHGLENQGLGYRWFVSHSDKRRSGLYFQSSLTSGRPILPSNDLDFTEIVPTIYKEGGHGCDFKDSKKPEDLLKFIIQITTQEGDLIGDFYAGSGTTLSCAIQKKRKCITSDSNDESLKICVNRVKNLMEGNLTVSNSPYIEMGL